MINSHDWGRQIQLSYYSGPAPYVGPNGNNLQLAGRGSVGTQSNPATAAGIARKSLNLPKRANRLRSFALVLCSGLTPAFLLNAFSSVATN